MVSDDVVFYYVTVYMIVMVYYQFFIGCQPYVEFACVALDGVGFYKARMEFWAEPSMSQYPR